MAVPARIWTLYVVTEAREALTERLPSLGGTSGVGCGVSWTSGSAGVSGRSTPESACDSIFAVSERTLDSSPRLVGGVDIGGDAVEEAREACPFRRCAVPEEVAEAVDVGDVSRPAMAAAGETGRSAAAVKGVCRGGGEVVGTRRGPGAGGATGLTAVTLRKCGCNLRPTGSKTPPDTQRGLHEPLQRELKTDSVLVCVSAFDMRRRGGRVHEPLEVNNFAKSAVGQPIRL